MKNSSTCSAASADRPSRRRPAAGLAVILAVAVAVAVVAVAAPAAAKKRTAPEDLMNPLLGLDYSHWLVGPISSIATEREVEGYLRLTSDAEAESFIQGFWETRNAGTKIFTKTPEQLYRERSEEADKRFTEAAYPGRRTDRGTILILYGEPESIEFRSPEKLGGPVLEVWHYAKGAAPGLDGRAPIREYRFVDTGELTVLYTGQTLRPDPHARPGRGFYH